MISSPMSSSQFQSLLSRSIKPLPLPRSKKSLLSSQATEQTQRKGTDEKKDKRGDKEVVEEEQTMA
jgi:hypothetical protein